MQPRLPPLLSPLPPGTRPTPAQLERRITSVADDGFGHAETHMAETCEFIRGVVDATRRRTGHFQAHWAMAWNGLVPRGMTVRPVTHVDARDMGPKDFWSHDSAHDASCNRAHGQIPYEHRMGQRGMASRCLVQLAAGLDRLAETPEGRTLALAAEVVLAELIWERHVGFAELAHASALPDDTGEAVGLTFPENQGARFGDWLSRVPERLEKSFYGDAPELGADSASRLAVVEAATGWLREQVREFLAREKADGRNLTLRVPGVGERNLSP